MFCAIVQFYFVSSDPAATRVRMFVDVRKELLRPAANQFPSPPTFFSLSLSFLFLFHLRPGHKHEQYVVYPDRVQSVVGLAIIISPVFSMCMGSRTAEVRNDKRKQQRRMMRGGRTATIQTASNSRKYLSTAPNVANTKKTKPADVLIVGGGPIGSSTAFHLSQMQHGDGSGITIVEKDPTYKSASAMASVGGLRQQFSLKENIEMSLYGRSFIEQVPQLLRTETCITPDVQFVEGGYLFLSRSVLGATRLKENHATQVAAGCQDLTLHTKSELHSLFPWLNTDDISLGCHGSKGEGWFDPYSYLCSLREKNKAMGVRYLKAQPVAATSCQASGRIQSVELHHLDTNQTESIAVNSVVNATGAYSGVLVDLFARNNPKTVQLLPVKPRKRCVFYFQCDLKQEDVPIPKLAPLTVDPTGVYFRSEGNPGNGTFLAGVSPSADKDPDCWDAVQNLQVDHDLWDDIIWPALYHRVPAFGAVKVKSCWAGFYDYNTLDQNAIIDFHPDMPNLLLVSGFSGHGLQHSPAAGRSAAELLVHGAFKSIDLSIFSFDRCIENRPIFEQGIV